MRSGADEVLALEALRHGYGTLDVLRGVSLRLDRGEVVVLVGSSGSGKTTLLRLVAGLERPRAGRILLRGVTVADSGSGGFVVAERRGLGMVFQEAALWPQLRVRENVALAMANAGGRPEAVERLLEEVGLEGLGARRPDTLSGGQKQRVALARGLATGTDLLLLDEPLSALDEPVRAQLRPLIRDAVRRRNGSALMVSHDRLDAWHLADRIVVLEHGLIEQVGTPEALYTAPATETVARYMGAAGAVPVHGSGGGTVLLGDGEQLALAGVALGNGASGILLAYPEAVRMVERGLAAELVDRTFEGGQWRARWRLVTGKGQLEGLHDQPPPNRGTLGFIESGVFVFPKPAGDRRSLAGCL